MRTSIPQLYGDSIFRFVPQMRYDQQEIYNQKLENLGLADASEEKIIEYGDEELISLMQRYNSEKKDNEMELSRWEGQKIRYGQTIQLVHVKSNKYLAVTVKEVSTLEKQNLMVILDKNGSDSAKFIITPRYKVTK